MSEIAGIEFVWWHVVVAGVVSFVIGSINPATLIARARNIDLRNVGSGNPGATNVARALGKRAGVAVAILDILKGLIPVLVFGLWGPSAAGVAGICAVLGHIFSPFLHGRGGKGVATTGGAILGYAPWWAIPVGIAFALGFLVTRRMGLASIAASLALIGCGIWWSDGPGQTAFAVGLGAVVFARHWRNLAAAIRDWRTAAA